MSTSIVVPSIKHLNTLWPLEWRERKRNPPAFIARLPGTGGFLVQLEHTNSGWCCWVSGIPIDYKPHQSFSIAVERARVSTLDWLAATADRCRTYFDKLASDAHQPPVLPLGSRPPKNACLEILRTYASEARDSGATLGEIAEATGLTFVDVSPPVGYWKLEPADRLYSALTMLIRAASEVSVDHSTERYRGRLAKMIEHGERALAEYRRAGSPY